MGNWSDPCNVLNVCRRTVDRYIDFYHIVAAYPRLIVSELSFELIMTNYKPLNEYLNDDELLAARLKTPLKQTCISGGCVFSSRRMPGGGDELQEVPEELKSEGATWDPT